MQPAATHRPLELPFGLKLKFNRLPHFGQFITPLELPFWEASYAAVIALTIGPMLAEKVGVVTASFST
jgi:hypothetical protein